MTHRFKLKNKKIVITGGSGFIGSHLLSSLLDKNKVCVIDNEYRGSNLGYVKKKYSTHYKKNVQLEKCDIRDKEKILEIFKKFEPEIVFHLAAIAGVKATLNDPLQVINVNSIACYNLSEIISKTNSVKKIIYSSTSEVGGPIDYQLDENAFTTQGTAYDSRWSYATSKLLTEHIFVALERKFNIDVSIARLFNVYGPRQIGDGAIHDFVTNAIMNKPLIIHNDGSQIRTWNYIDDCVDGLLIIAEKGKGIYNIGNPHELFTTISLAKQIIDYTNSKSQLIFKKIPYSDIQIRVPNIEKISKLGYKPEIDLKEGLSRYVHWIKSEKRSQINSSKKNK